MTSESYPKLPFSDFVLRPHTITNNPNTFIGENISRFQTCHIDYRYAYWIYFTVRVSYCIYM